MYTCVYVYVHVLHAYIHAYIYIPLPLSDGVVIAAGVEHRVDDGERQNGPCVPLEDGYAVRGAVLPHTNRGVARDLPGNSQKSATYGRYCVLAQ